MSVPATTSEVQQPAVKTRAPTLWIIIAIKLIKGLLLLLLGLGVYSLSDNDLPVEFRHLLVLFHLDPEKRFFVELAQSVARITPHNVLVVAAGTMCYSLFSLVEGIGLIFRVSWAGWMAIGESVFFIPIEVYDLLHNFRWMVVGILALNILIVWYLFQNRHRLFKH